MNGITILSEYTYRVRSFDDYILFCGVLILMLIFVAVAIYKEYKDDKHITLEHIVCSIICILLAIVGITANINDYNTIYTDYKVTIDDSVGFNEFFENYEIVSSNEDVYTVRVLNKE